MDYTVNQTRILDFIKLVQDGGAPTATEIAAATGLAPSTVRSNLAKLEVANAVVRNPFPTRPGESDVFGVPAPAPEQLDAELASLFTTYFDESKAAGRSKCGSLRDVAHRWAGTRKEFMRVAVAAGHKPATASANYAAAKRGER